MPAACGARTDSRPIAARAPALAAALMLAAAAHGASTAETDGPVTIFGGQVQAIALDVPAGAEDYLLAPGAPYLRASLELGTVATDVVLADGLAFIAAGREGLLVVDTADMPRLIARLPLSGAVSRIRLSGETACLTGADGLVLVDVSNPAAPRLLTRVRMSVAPLDIAVGNDQAWLLFERELQQFDLTATPPVVRARITLASSARGLAAP